MANRQQGLEDFKALDDNRQQELADLATELLEQQREESE
jgi:hypothetical protein